MPRPVLAYEWWALGAMRLSCMAIAQHSAIAQCSGAVRGAGLGLAAIEEKIELYLSVLREGFFFGKNLMRDCSQKIGKSIDCDAICSQSNTLATSFLCSNLI